MAESHFWIHELSFEKKVDNSWSHRFNRPDYGFTLFYSNMNSDILGKGVGLYPYIDFPLIFNRRFLTFKSGMGLAYLSNKYDAFDNWQNVAIGSNLNILISLAIKYNLKFNDRITISTGPSLTHFSNGSTSFPNLGINLVNWSLTFKYTSQGAEGRLLCIKEKKEKKQFWNVSAIWGSREIKPYGSQNYNVFGLNLNYHIKNQRQFYWNTGLGVWHNNATEARLLRRELKDYSEFEKLRVGMHAGITFDFDTWYFLIQMGGYLFDQPKLDGQAYHRFGLLYNATDRFGINLTLKTHYARADHFELGVSYIFKRK